jgi:DNA-directed RNA polymerase sigma subunit (sigma70/sigma32)
MSHTLAGSSVRRKTLVERIENAGCADILKFIDYQRFLNQKHRTFLIERLRLSGNAKTLSEIADILDVTPERIRQIETLAVRKLIRKIEKYYECEIVTADLLQFHVQRHRRRFI